MHYGDKKQQEAQKLLITVYKDQCVDGDNPEEPSYDSVHVESIIEAKHVSTHSICQLHYNIEHILKDHIKSMKDDVFYLIDIKTDGWKFKIVNITEITEKMHEENRLLGLH
jgi:hypothetical protein